MVSTPRPTLLRCLLPLLWLGASPAFASSVTVQADDTIAFSFQADASAAASSNIASDSTLANAVLNGQPLTIGNRVLIGSFLITDAEIKAHANDVSYLWSHFVMYGDPSEATKVGDNYPGTTQGLFTNEVDGSADAVNIVGKQVYMFVLGSSDNSSFYRSLATTFQLGIYYYDITSSPGSFLAQQWTFASDSDLGNATTIDIADLTTNNAGQNRNAGARVVVGGPNPLGVYNTATNFVLQAVPEPATASLLLAGLSVLSFRRRRSA